MNKLRLMEIQNETAREKALLKLDESYEQQTGKSKAYTKALHEGNIERLEHEFKEVLITQQ